MILLYCYSITTGKLSFTKYYELAIDQNFILNLVNVIVSILGAFYNELFYAILLIDFISRIDTLLNVIRSVTRNYKSILLTGFMSIILIYFFSILGFTYFKDEFYVEGTKFVLNNSTNFYEMEDIEENTCQTLYMCLITVLNNGLRNGGGIGDYLKSPSLEVFFIFYFLFNF